MSGTTYAYEPDFAVHPGETLQETLEALGMDQRDLSRRSGLSEKHISQIINQRSSITYDVAARLEMVTRVPARMWNNLEAMYQDRLIKRKAHEQFASDLNWLKSVPVKDLVKRNAIKGTKDKPEQLGLVLQFFGVSSVANFNETLNHHQFAFRKSNTAAMKKECMAAWLRLGRLEANKIETEPFDEKMFRTALGKCKLLSVKMEDGFDDELQSICAKTGVAVVFIKEIKGCPVHGAARWLTPEKAMIQLTLRYKSDDQFWFSFFHEAAHILFDAKKDIFVDAGCNEDDKREKRANKFAGDFLVPPAERKKLGELTTTQQVKKFAKRLGISPGIVVGQMLHLHLIPFYHPLAKLRGKMEWADEAE